MLTLRLGVLATLTLASSACSAALPAMTPSQEAAGTAMYGLASVKATPAPAHAQKGPFTLAIDGVAYKTGLLFAGGLGEQLVEYHEGEDITSHLRPGRFKSGRAYRTILTLEPDSDLGRTMLKWRKAVLAGKVERKSVSIIFSNDEGKVVRVNLYGTYPTRWAGPALNARNSGHATEKIEVSWQSLELKSK